jgi:hypothetical protein
MFFVRYALLYLQNLVPFRVSLGHEIRTLTHARVMRTDNLAETFAGFLQKDTELSG